MNDKLQEKLDKELPEDLEFMKTRDFSKVSPIELFLATQIMVEAVFEFTSSKETTILAAAIFLNSVCHGIQMEEKMKAKVKEN